MGTVITGILQMKKLMLGEVEPKVLQLVMAESRLKLISLDS